MALYDSLFGMMDLQAAQVLRLALLLRSLVLLLQCWGYRAEVLVELLVLAQICISDPLNACCVHTPFNRLNTCAAVGGY